MKRVFKIPVLLVWVFFCSSSSASVQVNFSEFLPLQFSKDVELFDEGMCLNSCFVDYFPLGPVQHGTKTFTWIYGQTGEYQSYVSGSVVAPYTSGSIEATGIVNYCGQGETIYFAKNGNELQCIAVYDYDDSNDLIYLSTDADMSAHPETWTFSDITDNMYVDQGTYCGIDANLNLVGCESDQALLFQMQDITVPYDHYGDAIVLWWLDKKYNFMSLDFHGVDSALGIIPPTSEQTRGYSVTDWVIYGYGVGVIAHGGVDAATGDVPDIVWLTEVSGSSSFNDPVLKAAIGSILDVNEPGPEDMNDPNFTSLEITNANITDLTGLQYARYLTHLDLSNNNITDIGELTGLINLESLYLNNNSISDSDFKALSSLIRLQYLMLNNTNHSIEDIPSEWLSKLVNLRVVGLRGNAGLHKTAPFVQQLQQLCLRNGGTVLVDD